MVGVLQITCHLAVYCRGFIFMIQSGKKNQRTEADQLGCAVAAWEERK